MLEKLKKFANDYKPEIVAVGLVVLNAAVVIGAAVIGYELGKKQMPDRISAWRIQDPDGKQYLILNGKQYDNIHNMEIDNAKNAQ